MPTITPPTARAAVEEMVRAAVEAAQAAGALPMAEVDDYAIERPQRAENGDFSCSLAMKTARMMRMNPRAIGQAILDAAPQTNTVGRAWLAGPGFVNFSLSDDWLRGQVDDVIALGDRFGDSPALLGTSAQVEFVSVNPTGPVHVGHARGAVIGSALANVMEAAGCAVQREYYVNDAGRQMELFYETAYARYLQAWGQDAALPADGYQGDYMAALADGVKRAHGDRFLGMGAERAAAEIGEIALDEMVESIRRSLSRLGVEYDNWFRERDLYASGDFERVMALLDERGFRTEYDGAVWFAATKLGVDKDAALIRSNGKPTYFASDVAYHYDKLIARGFDRVVDIWGADHQGHVNRMKAAAAALGANPERLTLMIYQLVSFRRGDEAVRLSKRTGNIVTVDDLVDEVGADACRYFFLSRAAETQMEFDLELAVRQSADNPVYYVQYAHARIAGIIRAAQERGIEAGDDADISPLTHEAELALIRQIVRLPELVETMAANLEVHHLPHYARELATAFHWFYQQCRVVSDAAEDAAVTRARLRLCQAAKVALARCLALMGMGAPERM